MGFEDKKYIGFSSKKYSVLCDNIVKYEINKNEEYSIEIIPVKLQFLFQFNPLYQYLTATRTIVLYGQCPTALNLILCVAYALIALLVGCVVFKKNQDKFIYYI